MRVCLGDIADSIQTGPFGSQLHRSDYSSTGTPVIMPQDIVNWRLSTDKIVFVDDDTVERLHRHKVSYNDIIYPRRGDVAKCAIIGKDEENWICGTGCLKITINPDKANPKYVFYFMQQRKIGQWIEQHATGATMLNINSSTLNNLPLDLPELAIQNRVIEILSAYDDMIDNCKQQIALLEEAAQRLYREWFVDLRFPGHEITPIGENGLPEGWQKTTLESIATFINGFAFKPKHWHDFGLPIIKIKELKDGVSDSTPRYPGNEIPQKYHISAGDIIFSWSATLTADIWNGENGFLNQHLFKVIPNASYTREYVLQSILNVLTEFRAMANGSTMQHIQRGKLSEVDILNPSPVIMAKYANISEPIRQQILTISQKLLKIQNLKKILLPRLISGQIEIVPNKVPYKVPYKSEL